MALFISQLRQRAVGSMGGNVGCLNPREGQNVLWCWIFLHLLLPSFFLLAWSMAVTPSVCIYKYFCICVSTPLFVMTCCHGSCDPSPDSPQPPAVLGSLLTLNWIAFHWKQWKLHQKKTDLWPQCCTSLPPFLYDMSIPLPPCHSPPNPPVVVYWSVVMRFPSAWAITPCDSPHLYEGPKPWTSKATSFGRFVLS